MEKLNVAIADDNEKMVEMLGKLIDEDNELELVGKAHNGEEICKIIQNKEPDVVILDIFNSLGMPTSTTVSLVFELLGGTVAYSLIKIANDTEGILQIGNLMNTDKALTVILGIFTSVAIAFIFGTLVQYISRLIFTFNYRKTAKYFIGLFGGLAATSIVYFMLFKGLKSSPFLAGDGYCPS